MKTLPDRGDMILNPGNDEMLIYDGTEWIAAKEPFNKTSESYFRKKFEEESELVHEQHPELKKLWEEYRIIRNLLGV